MNNLGCAGLEPVMGEGGIGGLNLEPNPGARIYGERLHLWGKAGDTHCLGGVLSLSPERF